MVFAQKGYDEMNRPDFAHTDLNRLEDRDLRCIIEHFPLPGRSYEEIARVVHDLPTTLESILSSDFLFQRICDKSELLLDVSPFLLFNVLLRHTLTDHRTQSERRIINYLANLLSVFVHTDRMLRVQPYDSEGREYLIDLISESEGADANRQFLIYAHIGNYSLFLTGLFPQWIEYRHRYKRRPVDMGYYIDFGRTYFNRAASHRMANELGLDDVFFRLAVLFESYQSTLNHISRTYLAPS